MLKIVVHENVREGSITVPQGMQDPYAYATSWGISIVGRVNSWEQMMAFSATICISNVTTVDVHGNDIEISNLKKTLKRNKRGIKKFAFHLSDQK